MQKTTRPEFTVDNASILFLSLIRPYHTNNFRISITLTEPICPECRAEQEADGGPGQWQVSIPSAG